MISCSPIFPKACGFVFKWDYFLHLVGNYGIVVISILNRIPADSLRRDASFRIVVSDRACLGSSSIAGDLRPEPYSHWRRKASFSDRDVWSKNASACTVLVQWLVCKGRVVVESSDRILTHSSQRKASLSDRDVWFKNATGMQRPRRFRVVRPMRRGLRPRYNRRESLWTYPSRIAVPHFLGHASLGHVTRTVRRCSSREKKIYLWYAIGNNDIP